MKYLSAITLFSLSTIVQPAFADDHSMISPNLENYIGYGAIITVLLFFVIVMLVLLRTFKILARVILKSDGYTDEEILAEMAPVKAKTEKKSKIGNYPAPHLFNYLFYGAAILAICYLLNYKVFHFGQSQYERSKTEIGQAGVAKKLYLSEGTNKVDENTVKLTNDPVVIASGQTIFKTNCVACHGDHAQGIVGPNLTDDYWLHGGKITDVYKTIKNGVLTKGMPTWEKVLSAKQISDVANYVKSLHGTDPANPKAREGVKETDDNKTASN